MSLPTSDAIRAARMPIYVIARSERDDAIQLFFATLDRFAFARDDEDLFPLLGR
jgi:hypothetical protein